MKGDMVIKDLDLEPKINAMMRDFWRYRCEVWRSFPLKIIKQGIAVVRLSLLCGDGSSMEKAFTPIASWFGVGLDPRPEVCGMSIRFAPTGWCRIEESTDMISSPMCGCVRYGEFSDLLWERRGGLKQDYGPTPTSLKNFNSEAGDSITDYMSCRHNSYQDDVTISQDGVRMDDPSY
ncbi:hypothetical protein Tco_1302234 [Tanacetum coccineum]